MKQFTVPNRPHQSSHLHECFTRKASDSFLCSGGNPEEDADSDVDSGISWLRFKCRCSAEKISVERKLSANRKGKAIHLTESFQY